MKFAKNEQRKYTFSEYSQRSSECLLDRDALLWFCCMHPLIVAWKSIKLRFFEEVQIGHRQKLRASTEIVWSHFGKRIK
jgi:hypothetical protein